MNILFDYDGTLHDCMKIYRPAFLQACQYLENHDLYHFVATKRTGGLMPDLPWKQWTEKDIQVWLGYSAGQMWNKFTPNLDKEEQQKCSALIGENMLKFVREGKAQLYSSVEETLKKLKQCGHTLIFLSNCKHAYMNAHIDQFHLEKYFDAFYCAQDYDWKPKQEIFYTIKDAFPGSYIIVGDRIMDMMLAKAHRLPAVGCAYGYGTMEELSYASAIAKTPEDLFEAIGSLCLDVCE